MTFTTIRIEGPTDGVCVLTFDRPEVRNALDRTMVDELRAALAELAGLDEPPTVIFTGSERAFVSGADIAQLRDRGRLDALRRINSDLFRELERYPAPTIAAIRGFALGGGCELALACDLRVAGEGARLGQPEVGLGIIPGAGATYRLPRLVGLGRARELIFTGRILRAGEALAIGLVEEVVPDDQVLAAARALASRIAANSGLAVRLAKQALNQSTGFSLDAGQALESALQAVLFEDEEKRRRMTAFLERKGKKGGASPSGPDAPPAIAVDGLVDRPLELDFDGLLGLPAAAQVPDVAARVPGKEGRAVRLGALLERAGVAAEAAHIAVTARAGGFGTSLPVAQAGEALLVYSLHGRPLPAAQGGPFRLLIPGGDDGCANIKDVGRLEARAAPGERRCGHTDADHARIRQQRGT